LILWNDSIKLAQPLRHNRIKYAQKKLQFLAGAKNRRVKQLVSKRKEINFIRINFIKNLTEASIADIVRETPRKTQRTKNHQ